MPPNALAIRPKHGRPAYGPVCPYPVIRSTTSRGFARSNTSGPSPHRSSVPAWKFSTTTSAPATMRRNSAAPSASRRSSVTDRLFRPSLSHTNVSPAPPSSNSLAVPSRRAWSPTPGSSTFTTSAPCSAISVAANGAAMNVPMSSTPQPRQRPMLQHSPFLPSNSP